MGESSLSLLVVRPKLGSWSQCDSRGRSAARRPASEVKGVALQPQLPSKEKAEKAPPGFEPGIKDLQSSALATWPRRQLRRRPNARSAALQPKTSVRVGQEARLSASRAGSCTKRFPRRSSLPRRHVPNLLPRYSEDARYVRSLFAAWEISRGGVG